MKKIENEMKSKKKDYQIKYQYLRVTLPIETNEEILRKIIFLCESQKIEILKQENISIHDKYYDSLNFDLLHRNITFRKRRNNDSEEFTIKYPISRDDNKFSRKEKTKYCTTKDRDSVFQEILRECFGKEEFGDKIQDIVSIHNARMMFHLSDAQMNCVLCFDKYYFYSGSDTSEYYYQVEFGSTDSIISEKFSNLINFVKVLFDFKSEKNTKYKQAIDWLKDKKPKIKNVSAIMLDIVKYSLRDNLIQKNIIQHLNKEVKEIINELYQDQKGKNEWLLVYIPTGDGMIIVVDDIPEKLPSFCAEIQAKIREHNENVSDKNSRYFIRIGVNYGPVFMYSDIKENLNFAGNGINMVQRITNLGDESHILFSKEAYDLLSETKKSNFSPKGQFKVKHGESLNIYSLYSHAYKFGNPADIG